MILRLIPVLVLLLLVGCGQKVEEEVKIRPLPPLAEEASASQSAGEQATGEAGVAGEAGPIAEDEAMRELRLMALTVTAEKVGIERSEAFPEVYGVLMEFRVEAATATVLAFSDGNASLYTTSGFGVLGGSSYESVRRAAIAFVKEAGQVHAQAEPVAVYPYPAPDRLQFFLLTYDGVRLIDTDIANAKAGTSELSPLYLAGQALLTELRLVSEKQALGREVPPKSE